MISSSIDPKLAAANLAMQAKLAHYGIAGLIWPNGTISKLFHYNGWHMPTYYLDWSADQSYDVLIYSTNFSIFWLCGLLPTSQLCETEDQGFTKLTGRTYSNLVKQKNFRKGFAQFAQSAIWSLTSNKRQHQRIYCTNALGITYRYFSRTKIELDIPATRRILKTLLRMHLRFSPDINNNSFWIRAHKWPKMSQVVWEFPGG